MNHTTKHAQRRFRLSLEQLERRELLATAVLEGSTIVITGTGAADRAEVQHPVASSIYVVRLGPLGDTEEFQFPTSKVQRIKFLGFAGNDFFWNGTTVPCTANGGEGRDTLYGGGGNDTILGGTEDDFLRGGGGADVIFCWQFAFPWTPPPATPGNDQVFGDGGSDTLIGNGGDDYLVGGTESDEIHGFGGADRLYGNEGNDSLFGGKGQDHLYGGSEKDLLDGGNGADALWGEGGQDSLFGGRGADYLNGGGANDHLYDRAYDSDPADPGLFGTDTIIGGSGYDIAHGFEFPTDNVPVDDVEEFQLI
jgi:Ca2+-binding RTX toxin-like protein